MFILSGAEMRRKSHEEILQAIEDTANLLRGMTMDPDIPTHAKQAMWPKIKELEDIVERETE